MRSALYIPWGCNSDAIKFLDEDPSNPIADASAIGKHLSHQIVVVVSCAVRASMALDMDSMSQKCALQPGDLVATSSKCILLYFIEL